MTADRIGGASRVLAIRLDTIGDVVMTAPALQAIRASGAEVTLLTSPVAAPLEPLLLGVSEVLALDVPWMKPAEDRRAPAREHLAALDEIRARHFDAAVIFTVSTQDPACAAYLAYLAGIPRVAAHVSGRLYGLVTDPVPDADPWPPERHEIQRQLDLVAALGYDTSNVGSGLADPEPSPAVERLLGSFRGHRWCLVHPGASAQSRRYPAQQWGRVIDLLSSHGVHAVIAGSADDATLVDEVFRSCRCTPKRVDGRFDLAEFAALMAAAPVAATCNSAAAHIAAAFDTPLVTLYAGTNPQHTPYSSRAHVLRHETECAWCLSSTCAFGEPRCLAEVAPHAVSRAVMTALEPARELVAG